MKSLSEPPPWPPETIISYARRAFLKDEWPELNYVIQQAMVGGRVGINAKGDFIFYLNIDQHDASRFELFENLDAVWVVAEALPHQDRRLICERSEHQ